MKILYCRLCFDVIETTDRTVFPEVVEICEEDEHEDLKICIQALARRLDEHLNPPEED